MGTIIGICGRAGAGKGAVAKLLEQKHGFTVISFADPIYAAVSAITGIPVESLSDRSAKEQIIPAVGKSPRELLQTLGTEWGRDLVSPDLWANIAMARAKTHEKVVIPDVRFDNEAVAIKQAGGAVWRVVGREYEMHGGTSTHVSEAGVSASLVDATLRNASDLVALFSVAEAAIRRLLANTMSV